MTDAPTLSEVLALMVKDTWGYDGDGPHRLKLEASLYGIEEDCPECGGQGEVFWDYDDPELEATVEAQAPCPRCQGTGKVRGRGLVERVEAAARKALAEGGDSSLSGVLEVLRGVSAVLEALRTELGEVPKDG